MYREAMKMGETNKTIDSWFAKIQKYVVAKIGHFVAFLFFLIALGAFLMMMFAQRYPNQAIWVVIAPAAAGLLAYYNRGFAIVLFVGLFFLMLFL